MTVTMKGPSSNAMGRSIDLTGQRFGKLTVEEKTDKRQQSYFLWRCRCDCGGEILVNTKHLKRGTITNCGCIPKPTARRGTIAEDLTGRQFGDLTVLRRAKNRRGRTCWVCRCSCGKIHTATAHELKQGRCSSCGDDRHKVGKGLVDLSGQRFGRLTVLEATSRRDKKGSVYWRCRCDCGKELEATQDNLMYGNYRSCGCRQEEIRGQIHDQLHFVDGTILEIFGERKAHSDNASGFRGISVLKNGRFSVTIGFKRKKYYIGRYGSFEDAVAARLEAESLIHDGFVKAYYAWKAREKPTPHGRKQIP